MGDLQQQPALQQQMAPVYRTLTMAQLDLTALPKFNGENFELFKIRMLLYFKAYDLLDYAEGKVPLKTREDIAQIQNADEKEKQRQILQTDAIGQYLLMCALDDKFFFLIQDLPSMHSAWTKILTEFDQTDSVTCLLRWLTLKLAEGGDLPGHLLQIEALASKLRASGEHISSAMQIGITLASLPPSYAGITRLLLAQHNNDLTYEIVKTTLLAH